MTSADGIFSTILACLARTQVAGGVLAGEPPFRASTAGYTSSAAIAVSLDAVALRSNRRRRQCQHVSDNLWVIS